VKRPEEAVAAAQPAEGGYWAERRRMDSERPPHESSTGHRPRTRERRPSPSSHGSSPVSIGLRAGARRKAGCYSINWRSRSRSRSWTCATRSVRGGEGARA